ncbi:MAG TPA: ABC transporter ATP-binding protein [Solirubrobacteraceae bacterium]|nr:ABC transporter ATP-binding protein [Solirubrobacteraceae bacterium]
MSELQIRGVWKGYGRQPVLRGVDLDVQAGSLTAVLGLSGCGKTTLLRVIAGFEHAERGTVTLAGRELDGPGAFVAPERRDVGYVPQEGALFPHLSVAANVGFGLTRAERRGGEVDRLLEMVGVGHLSERLPHQLSGGEQQRVALARALARRPAALLLDEPFSSLDDALRGRLREEVHALLREQGVTTVLVTHDREEALSLADSVAVLRSGVIIQHASPTELYEHPADRDLAGFLGEVNLVPAQIRDGSAHTGLGVLELHGGVAGDASMVMLRPEQLVVSAGEGEGLAGTVAECRYYGHDALLQIRPEGSGQLLLARVHGEQALPSGTPVRVRARGPVAAVEDAEVGA